MVDYSLNSFLHLDGIRFEFEHQLITKLEDLSEKYKAQNTLLKEVDLLNLEMKKENEELTEKFQKEKRRNESLETELHLLREQLKQREKSAERRNRSHSKSNKS